MPKRNGAKQEKAGDNGAEGTELFPLPETPLGEAAKEFVGITSKIAKLKLSREQAGEQVLAELKKEGRSSLKVTVGNDNWLFEVKHGEDEIRCAKITRQPLPKTAVSEEKTNG